MTRVHPWSFGEERAGAEENGVKKNARPKEFVLWAGILGAARGGFFHMSVSENTP